MSDVEVVNLIVDLIAKAVLDYTGDKLPELDHAVLAKPIDLDLKIQSILQIPGGKWPSVISSIIYTDARSIGFVLAK